MWDASAPNPQCRNVLGPKCPRYEVSVHSYHLPLLFHCFTLSSKPIFSENLMLRLSLFLSVGLISWLKTREFKLPAQDRSMELFAHRFYVLVLFLIPVCVCFSFPTGGRLSWSALWSTLWRTIIWFVWFDLTVPAEVRCIPLYKYIRQWQAIIHIVNGTQTYIFHICMYL